jgi:hypothetical protein
MKNLGDNPMPSLLERHWPKLALLLTVSLLAGLFFVPALAQGFVLPLIALMLGMGLLLLALRHWRAYRAGKLSRPELARNIVIETAILLLVFILARIRGRAGGGVCAGRLRFAAGTALRAAGRRGGGIGGPQDVGAVGQGVRFIVSFATHNQKPPTLNERAAGLRATKGGIIIDTLLKWR